MSTYTIYVPIFCVIFTLPINSYKHQLPINRISSGTAQLSKFKLRATLRDNSEQNTRYLLHE